MAELAKPWELLDLRDGESTAFRVERYERGEITITARHDGSQKTLPAMRVYVPAGDKPTGVAYWDITSLTLQAQLQPYLDNPNTRGRRFMVTAHGVRPVKRYSLLVT
jgi:hypothetical protein